MMTVIHGFLDKEIKKVPKVKKEDLLANLESQLLEMVYFESFENKAILERKDKNYNMIF